MQEEETDLSDLSRAYRNAYNQSRNSRSSTPIENVSPEFPAFSNSQPPQQTPPRTTQPQTNQPRNNHSRHPPNRNSNHPGRGYQYVFFHSEIVQTLHVHFYSHNSFPPQLVSR